MMRLPSPRLVNPTDSPLANERPRSFYMIVSLLILVLSRVNLERTLWGMVIVAQSLRVFNYLFLHQPRFEYLSFVQFDLLSLGVLTALLHREQTIANGRITPERLTQAGIVCAVLLPSLGFAVKAVPSLFLLFTDVFLPPLLGIATAALLLTLWRGGAKPLAKFLSWKPFLFLGQISYGLYVYHNFTFVLVRNATGPQRWLRIGIALLATIVVATASYYLMERPINEQKRRFPYAK